MATEASGNSTNIVDISQYMTTAEAAKRLAFTTGRVRQLVRWGEFSDVLRVGARIILIHKSEVEKRLENPVKKGRPVTSNRRRKRHTS